MLILNYSLYSLYLQNNLDNTFYVMIKLTRYFEKEIRL